MEMVGGKRVGMWDEWGEGMRKGNGGERGDGGGGKGGVVEEEKMDDGEV